MSSRARALLSSVGRAFRHRNYRLFFLGQGTSLVGTWITRVATSWLVYRLTGSAWLLGVVGFAGQIPTFLLAPFAGVIVDRSNRRRVLLVTQALAMLQSALLAVFAFTETISVWHVLTLSVAQGLINAFDTPARQAFLIEIVDDREDLPNAIALNSSMMNGARLIGPTMAGILIAAFGEAWCFAIDGASYLAVIGSLVAMRLVSRERRSKTASFAADLQEGLRYVVGFKPIRALLLLLAVVSFTAMPYTVLMPVFARAVLGGGPHLLGILMAAVGVGAVLGAIGLASRRSVLGLGQVLVGAGVLFGTSLIGFSFSRVAWLSVPILALTGAGMMVQMAATNTLIQTLAKESVRGRVMSFYTMAFFGMTPFGSLASGWLASRFGAPVAVRLGGIVTLVAVAVFMKKLPSLRELARPTYVERGILPGGADVDPRPLDSQRILPET